MFMTAVQVKASPRVIGRTLPDQDVLLRQPRLVARDEFLGRRAGRGFQDWKAGDECYTAGKGQQDLIVPVNHGRLW